MKANEIRHYLNSVFLGRSISARLVHQGRQLINRSPRELPDTIGTRACGRPILPSCTPEPVDNCAPHGQGWCACKGPPNDSAVRRAKVLAGMTREKLQTVIFRIFDSGLSCHEVRQLAQSTSSS
jgi:hypothetical protein